MAVRFKNDTTIILWIAAIGGAALLAVDFVAKVWVLARAWF